MSSSTRRLPADWSTPAERRYAERQGRLADHYGLDVESYVIDSASVRVHYLTAGDPDGAPVLLLNGFSAPAAIWLSLVPALADGYRLIIPDMPGQGLSAKPNFHGRDLRSHLVGYLHELLDTIDINRPHVVGNSLGGWQAFLLAIDADRVDRLCLVGAPVGVSREFPWPIRLLTVRGLNRLLLWATNSGDPIENARSWVRQFAVVDTSAVPEAFYELYAARQALPGVPLSLRTLIWTRSARSDESRRWRTSGMRSSPSNARRRSSGAPRTTTGRRRSAGRWPSGCPTPSSTRSMTTATDPGWSPATKRRG